MIHPGQIETVNRAFSPSQEQRDWAKELLDQFGQHEKEGRGAFTFRGHMIDMPLVRQARNVILLGQLEEGR